MSTAKVIYPDNPTKGDFYHLQDAPRPLQTVNEAGQRLYRIGNANYGFWSVSKGETACQEPPAIGSRVMVNMNQLGAGEVVGYFTEGADKAGEKRYLGVEVKLDQRPEWHIKQNGDKHPTSLVFGVEVHHEARQVAAGADMPAVPQPKTAQLSKGGVTK